jgi:hypothetical protein
MNDNEKERCPYCGSIIDEREIALFSGMVNTLKRVFDWCERNNKFEFKRKDVKHLIHTDNEIARFGDWIMFGGLIYRPENKGKGYYGLNRGRVIEFFLDEREIPTKIWKNPITGELKKEDYQTIKNIPHLAEFLDENDEYIARYREPKQGTLIRD